MGSSEDIGNALSEALMVSLSTTELQIFDAIQDGLILCDAYKVLYANKATFSLFGLADNPEKLLNSSFMKWVYPKDHNMVRSAVIDYFKSGIVTHTQEFRIVRDDGETRWVCTKNVEVNLTGLDVAVTLISDITDRKALEVAKRNSETLFHNIFRLSPEIMVLSSLTDHKIIDVNPAFLNQLGLRRDDTVGKSVKDLKIWADNTFIDRFVEEMKMTASMTDVPATMKARGGAVRHFKLFAQKIEQTKSPMLLLIGRDVTDELLHAQELKESRDQAQLANRTKSEFLANMSHELRTPLNAILGFSEIIRDEIIGPVGAPRYKEYAEDIYDSGCHLLSIINDILDLSKVESGKLEAYHEWIVPSDCLDMCMMIVQQRAFDSGLKLSSECVKNVELEADERLLKQICLNLLSNAIKFTPEGGEVHLALEHTANAGLCLSVTDTGIGMSPDEVKIARRPFGQVDSSYGRNHDGSGLGLPLVIAFAEKMEATMSIDSAKGKGTRVSIVFPPLRVRLLKGDIEEHSLIKD